MLEISQDMDRGMRTLYPYKLNKGFILNISESYLDQQTAVEVQGHNGQNVIVTIKVRILIQNVNSVEIAEIQTEFFL